jgi:hypothetical protein
MKKLMAVLTLVLFGLSQPAFAGAVILSESELDGVHAGDSVTIAKTGEEIVPAWYNSNEIELEKQSQKNLNAVQNINSVDSADSVQSNIARTSVGAGVINGESVVQKNDAVVENNNPSKSTLLTEESSASISKATIISGEGHLDCSKTEGGSKSFTSSRSESYAKEVTFDLPIAVSCASDNDGKDGESESLTSLSVTVDYDHTLVAGRSETCEAGCSNDRTQSLTIDTTLQDDTIESCEIECKKETKTRDNLSENNHLDIELEAQMNLMAVSNLNSVGSGSAVQANIASNVGVGGSYGQASTAIVVNGL